MEKYTLFTWPDSQEYVSNPACILICPPVTDVDPTALDSSYMVPNSVYTPAETERQYVRLEHPDNQDFNEMLDSNNRILHDYDGGTFVETTLYEKSLHNPVHE